MKILFVIEDSNGKRAVSTWKEIKQNKGDISITRETYLKFKALELNKEFESEIVESRKRLNIPEHGYGWEKYFEFDDNSQDDFQEELERLCNKNLSIFDYVIFRCMAGLLYSSCVVPNSFITDNEEISIRFDDQDVDSDIPESVLISIEKPVSKNHLINFIKYNWFGEHGIESELKKLNSNNSFKVSERDLRIAEIKYNEPKKTFRTIADQIIKEFNIDDPDSKINEFSVKTANDRVMDKVYSLAKRRK